MPSPELERLISEHPNLLCALEHAPVGFTVADARAPDCPLIFVNQTFVRLTGYSAEEAIGKNCRFLQGAETDPEQVAILRRGIEAARPCVAELLNYRKDGISFWNRVEMAPVFDEAGALTHFTAIQTDCTAQREAEMAVVRDQHLIDFISSFDRQGILIIDGEDRLLHATRGVEALLGVPPEKLDRAAFGQLSGGIEGTADHLPPPLSIEWRHPDGMLLPLIVHLTPLDTVRRIRAMVITEPGHHVALEQELRAARQSVEYANRAKTSFLATMSHELRTPLNAIIGFAEVMQVEAFGALEPSYKEYSEDIARSARHLLSIINTMLDLTKIESGRLELREETLELGEIVQSCMNLLHDQSDRSEVTVDLDLGDGVPQVFADANKLRQIVLNVLSNAIKFTSAGGSIKIALCRLEEGVSIAVRDTGIGMSEEQIKVALEPFGQVDSELGRQFEGTGLGVPLCRALTELHGGRFHIDSAPGEGTTVTVTLPEERIMDPSRFLASRA